MEDDFEFTTTPEILKKNFDEFFKTVPIYDIIMLSYNLHRGERFNEVCGRVFNAQTASGYMIHKDFLDKLIDVYKEAVPKLIESHGKDMSYVCDQSWKVLQKIKMVFLHGKNGSPKEIL